MDQVAAKFGGGKRDNYGAVVSDESSRERRRGETFIKKLQVAVSLDLQIDPSDQIRLEGQGGTSQKVGPRLVQSVGGLLSGWGRGNP